MALKVRELRTLGIGSRLDGQMRDGEVLALRHGAYQHGAGNRGLDLLLRKTQFAKHFDVVFAAKSGKV